MTDAEIDAEVERVATVARNFLSWCETHCDEHGYTDVRVHTWMVGAVVFVTDEDGDTRELVNASFETAVRTLQAGMVATLAGNAA